MSANAVSCHLSALCDGAAMARAAGECRERLGARPDLVIAFASSDHRPRLRELIESLRIDGRASRILGASCEGTIGVGVENEMASGLSLLFLALPETSLERFDEPGALRVSPLLDRNPAGFLVLADPLHGGQGPLRELNASFPGVPAVGGLISGGPDDRDLFLFDERGPVKSPFLAVGFSGGIRLRPFVAQSCRPIGEPLVVTRSRANVVHSIAGRAPYSVLAETYASLDESLRLSAEGNIFAGLAVRETVEDFTTGDFVIRPIVGTDLVGGKLVLSSPPRTGQTLQFQLRDAGAAAAALERECRRFGEEETAPIAAFICAGRGRGRQLHGEAGADAAILQRHLGKTPTAGFFGNGEFAPVADRNFRHDHALCGAVFYPA